MACSQSGEQSDGSPAAEYTTPATEKEPALEEDLPSDIATDLVGTEWALVSLYGSDVLDATAITLDIRGDRIGGFAGCNSYGGKATMDEGAFEAHKLSSTKKGCAEAVNRQEAAYLSALSGSVSYRVQDGRLEMQDAAGETTLLYVIKGQG